MFPIATPPRQGVQTTHAATATAAPSAAPMATPVGRVPALPLLVLDAVAVASAALTSADADARSAALGFPFTTLQISPARDATFDRSQVPPKPMHRPTLVARLVACALLHRQVKSVGPVHPIWVEALAKQGSAQVGSWAMSDGSEASVGCGAGEGSVAGFWMVVDGVLLCAATMPTRLRLVARRDWKCMVNN